MFDWYIFDALSMPAGKKNLHKPETQRFIASTANLQEINDK